MITKKITFKNYDEVEETKDFYFHLTKMELLRIETKYKGGIKNYLEKNLNNGEFDKVLELIEDIILTSYGVRGLNGKDFVKSKDLRSEFEYSEAYSNLIEEFLEHPEKMQEFVSKVVYDNKKVVVNADEPKQLSMI